jgi:hypothetical protein
MLSHFQGMIIMLFSHLINLFLVSLSLFLGKLVRFTIADYVVAQGWELG